MDGNTQVTNHRPDLAVASEADDMNLRYAVTTPPKQPVQNHLRSTDVEVGDYVNNLRGFGHEKRPTLQTMDAAIVPLKSIAAVEHERGFGRDHVPVDALLRRQDHDEVGAPQTILR